MEKMSFSDLVHARHSIRVFEKTPVPREVIREIVSLAQWAPYSCNLQLTQCTVVDDPALLARLAKEADGKFAWAPCIVVLSRDARFGNARKASHVSTGGIMQTILLAATDKGLASCPMAGFRGDATIKRILGLPQSHEIDLLIALGYPRSGEEKQDRYRLPIERFAFWNTDSARVNDLRHRSMFIRGWKMADIRSYRARLAPVYLYRDHYRLHVFSRDVFTALLRTYRVHRSDADGDILDLCTYDGTAFRGLLEICPDAQISFADHLPYIGRVFSGLDDRASFVSIDDTQKIDAPSDTYDAVTCFHKIEFTPDWEDLMKEAQRVLKPGGMLFISTMQPTWFKYLFDLLRSVFAGPGLHPSVYDGNPFYKIGPFGYRRLSRIRSICRAIGFDEMASGIDFASGGGKVRHRYGWAVFIKKH